ncbi:MAG TPA: peptidoglycan-binding protein [Polyangiaceae bacterium]|nr:peptidoglycan-binding protein [Polyangiaceae bacterium]
MATTTQVRRWWAHRRCQRGIPITLLGRHGVLVAPGTEQLWRAFEQTLLATGYGLASNIGSHRNCPAGIGGKTCEPSGKNCSLHNYDLAADVDPWAFGNPHFRRRFGNGWDFSDIKFTEEQVRAVEAIRTTQGSQPFRWLGWAIGDTMHWQINVPPSDVEVDWGTVPDADPPEPEKGDEVLKRGDRGHAVTWMQQRLLNWNPDSLPRFGADGDFGAETETAVVRFQQAHDLDPTGVIGSITATLLHDYAPTTVPADVLRVGDTVRLEPGG